MLKYILITISTLILIQNLTAQTHPFGATLLSASDYAQLPKADWGVISNYGNPGAIINNTPPPSGTTVYGTGNGQLMLVTPPVGDQGSEGSCVGWAVGYSAMSILTYSKFCSWSTSSERSPNYIYNQIKLKGCEYGSITTDALILVKNQGDCSLNLMPYIDGDCTTQPNATQMADAKQNKAINWTRLNNNSDVNEIKQGLNLGLPIVSILIQLGV